MGETYMTEEELKYCALCGPLEDAIEMIDRGQLEAAKALLERILVQARRMARKDPL